MDYNTSNFFHVLVCNENKVDVWPLWGVKGVFNFCFIRIEWTISYRDFLSVSDGIIFLNNAMKQISAFRFTISKEFLLWWMQTSNEISWTVDTITCTNDPWFPIWTHCLSNHHSTLNNCKGGVTIRRYIMTTRKLPLEFFLEVKWFSVSTNKKYPNTLWKLRFAEESLHFSYCIFCHRLQKSFHAFSAQTKILIIHYSNLPLTVMFHGWRNKIVHETDKTAWQLNLCLFELESALLCFNVLKDLV